MAEIWSHRIYTYIADRAQLYVRLGVLSKGTIWDLITFFVRMGAFCNFDPVQRFHSLEQEVLVFGNMLTLIWTTFYFILVGKFGFKMIQGNSELICKWLSNEFFQDIGIVIIINEIDCHLFISENVIISVSPQYVIHCNHFMLDEETTLWITVNIKLESNTLLWLHKLLIFPTSPSYRA